MREEARHFCQQEKTAWQKKPRDKKMRWKGPPFPLEGCSPPPLCMRAVCPSAVARTEQRPWLVGSPEIRVEMTCSVSLTRGSSRKKGGKSCVEKSWQFGSERGRGRGRERMTDVAGMGGRKGKEREGGAKSETELGPSWRESQPR